MIWTVRDDRHDRARGIGQDRRTIGRIAALAAMGAVALWGASGPAAWASELTISVREAPKDRARLMVPLNRSVIIDASEPLSRIEVVESGIATVTTITATQFVVTGVGYGSTQVMLWSDADKQQVLEVVVELDLARLEEVLGDIDPQSNVTASSINGSIVLSGTVGGPEIADRMMQVAQLFVPPNTASTTAPVQNHLRVGGEQQVLLRTTVAEVSRSAARTLGINGFMAGDHFQDAFVVNQLGQINPANIGAAADVNVQNTIPFLTGQDGIPLLPTTTLSLGFPRVQMQVFLQALADNSLLKILAEPNLVAVSGETASFLAGGEFPIPVPQAGSAAGAVTIEFREFGVRMNFTPVVMGDQKIRMRIAPEVSETDFSTAIQIQGFVVPGLTQRRVETTVEVGNGQTLAVAGLLSEEVRGIASRIPAIGDVPILGALFRSVEYQRRETELVILVTPEIIAPVDPNHVPKIPGEDYVPPNDYELYALGLLDGEAPEAEGVSDPDNVYQSMAPVKVAPRKSEPEELSIHGPWGPSTTDDL